MKKLDRATKYTIIICIAVILFNAAFGFALTKVASGALRAQIEGRMLDISNTAAAMINGDELEKLTADDVDLPEYQRVMSTLTYFQKNIDLRYIYCIMQKSEKEFVFGPDPTVEDPGEFGSPIVYTDALYNASKGTASVDEEPYEDAWGEFYSAYSPVFDSGGNVAGIVAVDFSAEWYRDQLRNLTLITAGFAVVALAVGLAFALSIAAQYRKFFMNLIKKMNDLSTGIETLISEVAPDASSAEHTGLPQIDGKMSMNNAISLLGEKILIMQVRLAKQIEIIRAHAYIDGLTGMNNRTSYEEYLKILEKKIQDDPRLTFSLVVFDINQLKIINDDFGHDMGDKLIIEVSKDIRSVFGNNRIYRIGGDEFVSIMDDNDPSEKMQNLKDVIAKKYKDSSIFNNDKVEVGVSMGGATYISGEDKSYIEVFRRADNAMYAAKQEFYRTHEDRRKRRG